MTKMPSRTHNLITEKFGYLFEPELIEAIYSNMLLKEASAGTVLIEIGQTFPGIPLLLSGSLKVFREDDQGNELLLYYIESGDTCAMSLTFDPKLLKSTIRAVVEEDAQFLIIPIAFLDKWMVQFASWRSFIIGSFNHRLTEMLDTIDNLAFKQLDERLKNYLSDKVKINGTTSLHLTHFEIAEELNSSRVVISRLLKQLESQGNLILHRNKIEMLLF